MASLSHHTTTYAVGTHNLGLDFFALADFSDADCERAASTPTPHLDSKPWVDTVPSLARRPHGVSREQALGDRLLLNRVRQEESL